MLEDDFANSSTQVINAKVWKLC